MAISSRTTSFQGLRLIGIVTIVAAHAGLNLVGGGNWCTFFFILSGFLYKAEINNWNDYRQYLKRKAYRLYPIYWFCLALYLLLAVIRGCNEQYTIGWDFIPHLFLIQSWIPSIHAQSYLGPAWFLSSLLFCYCASPIAKDFIAKGKWTIVIILGVMVIWKYAGLDVYISPVYRLFEYSLGLWLYHWLCNREQQKEFFPGFNLLLLLASLVLLHFGVGYWMNLIIFFGLIYFVFSFQSSSLQCLLGNRLILNLSKSDIFIYLTHPGIGFHFAFFLICTNSIVATLTSVVIGYGIYLLYKNVILKLIPIA